jgi:hypothetical protein
VQQRVDGHARVVQQSPKAGCRCEVSLMSPVSRIGSGRIFSDLGLESRSGSIVADSRGKGLRSLLSDKKRIK